MNIKNLSKPHAALLDWIVNVYPDRRAEHHFATSMTYSSLWTTEEEGLLADIEHNDNWLESLVGLCFLLLTEAKIEHDTPEYHAVKQFLLDATDTMFDDNAQTMW